MCRSTADSPLNRNVIYIWKKRGNYIIYYLIHKLIRFQVD